MARRFTDRAAAGSFLADHLTDLASDEDLLVLGLPRGGVPVAAAVAASLDAPLDVFLVRKLGVPGREELAMGAIASGGVLVVNDEVIRGLGIPRTMLDAVVAREHKELARREHLYRGARPALDLATKTVVLVDDGLATGSTMRAAVEGAKTLGAGKTIVAVPVGAPSTCADLAEVCDKVICPLQPERLIAVGFWYRDFSQVSDDEVRGFLGG
jgi:predicted phosphoribosyltransferase